MPTAPDMGTPGARGEKPNYNTKGWMADLRAEYKTNGMFGTPYIFGWYASGSDYDDVMEKQEWGILPSISTFGDGFFATKLGFDDFTVSALPSGKWGVVLGAEDMKFFDESLPKLSHTVRVAYYEGTNDKKLAKTDGNPTAPSRHLANSTRDFILMVKGDYFVELNLDNLYNVNENIEVKFNLAYINTNRVKEWGKQRNIDDVYSAVLQLKFKF